MSSEFLESDCLGKDLASVQVVTEFIYLGFSDVLVVVSATYDCLESSAFQSDTIGFNRSQCTCGSSCAFEPRNSLALQWFSSRGVALRFSTAMSNLHFSDFRNDFWTDPLVALVCFPVQTALCWKVLRLGQKPNCKH